MHVRWKDPYVDATCIQTTHTGPVARTTNQDHLYETVLANLGLHCPVILANLGLHCPTILARAMYRNQSLRLQSSGDSEPIQL
jgi:hypothetical protein